MTWTRNKSLMVNNLPGTGSESSMEIEKLTTELMLSRIELAQCKRALEKAEKISGIIPGNSRICLIP